MSMVSEARSLETRLDQLRAKWSAVVADAAAIDTEALLRAVPTKLVSPTIPNRLAERVEVTSRPGARPALVKLYRRLEGGDAA